MFQDARSHGLGLLGCLASLATSCAAMAQPPRSSVDVPASPTSQTPGPNAAVDQAFDPLAQATVVEGTVVQQPRVTETGTVPVTAGPTVPIVSFGNVTLRVVAGQRWQMPMTLVNNSGQTVSPILTCRFTNSGQVVETTRALLPPVPGGTRVSFTVYGPKTNFFVDHAGCQVDQP